MEPWSWAQAAAGVLLGGLAFAAHRIACWRGGELQGGRVVAAGACADGPLARGRRCERTAAAESFYFLFFFVSW